MGIELLLMVAKAWLKGGIRSGSKLEGSRNFKRPAPPLIQNPVGQVWQPRSGPIVVKGPGNFKKYDYK